MPQPPFSDWRLLPRDRGGPLRLAASASGVVLYRGAADPIDPDGGTPGFHAHQMTLSAVEVSGSGLQATLPSVASAPRLLPVEVQFDIARRDDGRMALAIEDFGGGINALDIGVIEGGVQEIETVYQDFNNYCLPRFVRGNAPPGRFVSVAIAGGYLAVVGESPAEPPITPDSAPFTMLLEAQSGVVISVDPTPPSSTETLLAGRLALLTFVEGLGPPSPALEFPGTLSFHRIAGGQPSGSPLRLFDADGSYDFDVDAQGGTALVLASTINGPQLLRLDLASGARTPIPWPSDYVAASVWSSSPTVAAVPGGTLVSFAFYEGSGDSIRGIRYGQIDLARLS